MTYLFSEAGLASLHGFVDPATLYGFDLDGTLAPIAADPGGILVPDAIQKALARLKKRAVVAVIPGRTRGCPASSRCRPPESVGNHGAEGFPDGNNAKEVQTPCG